MSDELELVRAWRRYLEHLAGKHNQKSHGNKYGSVDAVKSNVARLGKDKEALKRMAQRVRGDKKGLGYNSGKSGGVDKFLKNAGVGFGLESDLKTIDRLSTLTNDPKHGERAMRTAKTLVSQLDLHIESAYKRNILNRSEKTKVNKIRASHSVSPTKQLSGEGGDKLQREINRVKQTLPILYNALERQKAAK